MLLQLLHLTPTFSFMYANGNQTTRFAGAVGRYVKVGGLGIFNGYIKLCYW